MLELSNPDSKSRWSGFTKKKHKVTLDAATSFLAIYNILITCSGICRGIWFVRTGNSIG